jgi:DNA-binding transcriptional LysR family regulator
MLNVQRMRVLREVAARGSIAGAAAALWVTPPAVSQQLATLEREAGVPLLERDGRRVRLTEAGRRLVARTERVLAELEAAQAELASASSGGITGRLRVSAFPTAARSLLVPTLARLRAAHPLLGLSMTDFEPEDAMPALKTGHLDVVITYEWDLLPMIEDPGIEREELLAEPVYLAIPATHPLAGSTGKLGDFSEEQWIVGRDQTTMLEFVVASTARAGFTPKTQLHSMDFQVILAAVGAGLGVSLVPPLALIGRYPDVAFQQLEDASLQRRTYAVVRRGSAENPAIAAALGTLREPAAELAAHQPTGRAPADR